MGLAEKNNDATWVLMHGRLFVSAIFDAHDTRLFVFQLNAVMFGVKFYRVSSRKTSGEADFGRSFRVVAGPRLCVSPRVLRHKVSLRRAGLQKTQSLLLWVQLWSR